MQHPNPQAYNSAAFLHHEIATRLLSRLDLMLLQPQRVLELNCATGYSTQLLQQRYRKAHIVGLDQHLTLLKAAKNTGSCLNFWIKKPHFILASATDLPVADHSVDLLFANLFEFLAKSDLHKLLRQWQRVLKPGGLLMFTTFGPDTLLELKQSWLQVDNFSHVHDFLDMHDVGDALLQVGFNDPVMDREDFTLMYSDMQKLLHDLRNLGIRNKADNRNKGLTGKFKFTTVKNTYALLRNAAGNIPATIEIIYAHAWAPLETKEAQAEKATQIPITAIKGLKRANLT